MELIKEAGLNTLLGMGMTFLVLITLSLIIALFGKILNGGFKSPSAGGSGPEKQKPAAEEPSKALPATDAPQEEPALSSAPASPEEDTELMAVIAAAVAAYEEGVTPETVAVIAAAIAAYEGCEVSLAEKAGPSGFAVRRIRKSRRRVA